MNPQNRAALFEDYLKFEEEYEDEDNDEDVDAEEPVLTDEEAEALEAAEGGAIAIDVDDLVNMDLSKLDPRNLKAFSDMIKRMTLGGVTTSQPTANTGLKGITVYEALKKNYNYVKSNPIVIRTKSNQIFEGYLHEFREQMTRAEFDKLMDRKVSDTRYYFEEYVIEVI